MLSLKLSQVEFATETYSFTEKFDCCRVCLALNICFKNQLLQLPLSLSA